MPKKQKWRSEIIPGAAVGSDDSDNYQEYDEGYGEAGFEDGEIHQEYDEGYGGAGFQEGESYEGHSEIYNGRIIPKSRDFEWTELYENHKTKTAMPDIENVKNNMKRSMLQLSIQIDTNKHLAKDQFALVMFGTRPNAPQDDGAKKESRNAMKNFQKLEYAISEDRVSMIERCLDNHDKTVLPTGNPNKLVKKQWSYVTYKKFMVDHNQDLLYETQATAHWPTHVPWTIPFDLLRASHKRETEGSQELNQKIHDMLRRVSTHIPNVFTNWRLIQLLQQAQKTTYTPEAISLTLGENLFEYPEASTKTGYVIKGTRTYKEKKQENEGETEEQKVEIERKMEIQIDIGWLDVNVCKPYHNPATNFIVREAVHKCMQKTMQERYKDESISNVLAGVSIKITDYKCEDDRHPQGHPAQAHVIHLRPFGGTDQCLVSHLYFTNGAQEKDYQQQNKMYGILNTELDIDARVVDESNYHITNNSIQPYIMQSRGALEEHQLAHINALEHLRNWIRHENGESRKEIMERIDKNLSKIDQKTKTCRALRLFKASRIKFAAWDILVSTITESNPKEAHSYERTAHTIITVVNYPPPNAHFPNKTLHAYHKKEDPDYVHLGEGEWYEIKYMTGTIEEIKRDGVKNWQHSIFYWDLQPDRKPSRILQEKLKGVRKQFYEEMSEHGYPTGERLFQALLLNEDCLRKWQELNGKLIQEIVTEILKDQKNKGDGIQVEKNDNQLYSKDGFFFSTNNYEVLKSVVQLPEPIFKVYENYIHYTLYKGSIYQASLQYKPPRGRPRHEHANHRGGFRYGSRHSNRSNSSERGSRSSSSTRSTRSASSMSTSAMASSGVLPIDGSGNFWQNGGQRIMLAARREPAAPMLLSSQTRHDENNAILLKELLKRLDRQE